MCAGSGFRDCQVCWGEAVRGGESGTARLQWVGLYAWPEGQRVRTADQARCSAFTPLPHPSPHPSPYSRHRQRHRPQPTARAAEAAAAKAAAGSRRRSAGAGALLVPCLRNHSPAALPQLHRRRPRVPAHLSPRQCSAACSLPAATFLIHPAWCWPVLLCSSCCIICCFPCFSILPHALMHIQSCRVGQCGPANGQLLAMYRAKCGWGCAPHSAPGPPGPHLKLIHGPE